MTYTHLTTDELVLIESYFTTHQPVAQVAKCLKRARQTIYNVYHFLAEGHTALEYYQQYKENKARCGRHPITLPTEQIDYIKAKVAKGWNPDVLIGRSEQPIHCSVRTLYRMFQKGVFERATLPLKGKRKSNGHKEKRGKQAFRRSLAERAQDYPQYQEEFGHLEGDTIVGAHHKSAIITLVERQSKAIITLKPAGTKAKDIEETLNRWLAAFPKNLFKSITFDCGKEFSNWKTICNEQDIAIYFANPGTPSQRGLNEHSNGLLRRDGLPKQMDFNTVEEHFVQAIASKRNHIPRKSLNYRTPLESFLSYMDVEIVSRLI